LVGDFADLVIGPLIAWSGLAQFICSKSSTKSQFLEEFSHPEFRCAKEFHTKVDAEFLKQCSTFFSTNLIKL